MNESRPRIKFQTETNDQQRLVESIEKLSNPILGVSHSLSPNQEFRLFYARDTWRSCLLWVLQNEFHEKGLKRNSSAFSNELMKIREPLGKMFYCQLQLCRACFKCSMELSHELPTHYPNPIDWWALTMKEQILIEFERALSNKKIGKREGLETEIERVKVCLKESQNPYSCDEINTLHHFRLFDVALRIGKFNPREGNREKQLRKKVREALAEYIKALQAWKRTLRTDSRIKTIFSKDGTVYLSVTGKQTEQIYPFS